MVFIGPSTNMKRTHFIHKLSSLLKDILVKRSCTLSPCKRFGSIECSSHLKHDLALSSFANKIRENAFAKMRQTITANCPNISLLSAIFGMLGRSSFILKATKDINEPIDKRLIGIGHLNIRLIVFCTSGWITAKVTDVYRSFSVNDTGEVSKINISVFDSLVHLFNHVILLFKGIGTIQYNCKNFHIKLQPQRLSEVDALAA